MTTDAVRIATPRDEAGIMKLCVELHAENGQHSFSEPKVRAMVRIALEGKGGILGVIGPSDDIQGCILMLLDPVWYSDEFQLLELFNFVRSDARRSTHANSLIDFGKRCADETGLELTIGIMSNIKTEAKERLYQRRLTKAGTFYIYRPSSARAEPVAA